MDNIDISKTNLYKDMEIRTKGEIYLGIVGPVRTGKSTFIKRFMDMLVIPYMEDVYEKERLIDEMPQSGVGKTITTTEPKFVPKEAAKIQVKGDVSVKVRLVDCVGYMIPGAVGALEGASDRLVKTPWTEKEIPFTKAAEIGTEKVINEHSTIGIAVFTDGSFGEFKREDYIQAEERTIMQLKHMKKPYVIVLNTTRPFSDETIELAMDLQEKYDASVIPMNCAQMKVNDIQRILEQALYEFPVSRVEFYMPKWVELLSSDHPVKSEIVKMAVLLMQNISTMREFIDKEPTIGCEYLEHIQVENINLADGSIKIHLDIAEVYYYQMLSEMLDQKIDNEYQFMQLLKEFSEMKKEYTKVQYALDEVRGKGYGVVVPEKEEIKLEDPVIIKHGNKYGVKIKAESPSIHMIKTNIETEIAPIVGSEQQANDLIAYIQQSKENNSTGIWDTNIFGKTVNQLVQDGMRTKITGMGEDCQIKLQEAIQRIVNESDGRMICIIF